MNILRRAARRTIAAQITCIVMAAVLVGVGLASTVVFALFSNSQASANQDIMAAARAARIAAIVHKAEAFRTSEQLAHVLESYRSPTLDIQIVPLSALVSSPAGAAPTPITSDGSKPIWKTAGASFRFRTRRETIEKTRSS